MNLVCGSKFMCGIVLAAALLVTAGAPGVGSAQVPNAVELAPFSAPSPGLLGSGLFDLSRIQVHHSLSYGLVSSGAGSQSSGLWLTQFGVPLSSKLRFALDVGAVLDPSGQGPFISEQSFFVHRMELAYNPSKHFHLNISYVNVPNAAAPAFGYSSTPGFHPGIDPWGGPASLPR